MQNSRLIFYPLMLMLICSVGWAQGPSTVKNFVTQSYPHGVPYDKANSLGKNAIGELVTLLKNPVYDSYRPTIVLTIGMIGDSTGIEPLSKFLYAQNGEVSQSTFIAILAIYQAFGYMSQNGNQKALRFLSNWASPDYYKTAGLNFTYSVYKGKILGYVIRKLSIQGLGVSGRPEALRILNDIHTTENQKGRNKLNNDLQEAIDMNKKVKAEGASKVFGKEVSK